MTKLAVAVGDAYVKIAGGGAQAETAFNIAKKAVTAFSSGGGDVSKAAVTVDEAAKTVKVSDGTTCTTCDASGNCTTGGCVDK